MTALLFSLSCGGSKNTNAPANANTNVESEDYGEINDTWIAWKVKMALIADTRTSGFETDVASNDGAVTLSGKVDAPEAKSAADEVAKAIEGVKSVDNQLQVVPEAKRVQVDAKDDKIVEAIEKITGNDPKLQSLTLTADSDNGVVTINGTVDTQEELLAYAQAVRKIPGVKAVITAPVIVTGEDKSGQ